MMLKKSMVTAVVAMSLLSGCDSVKPIHSQQLQYKVELSFNELTKNDAVRASRMASFICSADEKCGFSVINKIPYEKSVTEYKDKKKSDVGYVDLATELYISVQLDVDTNKTKVSYALTDNRLSTNHTKVVGDSSINLPDVVGVSSQVAFVPYINKQQKFEIGDGYVLSITPFVS